MIEGLQCIHRLIDRMSRVIGLVIAWYAVWMVVIQFAVVIMRYVFGYGSIQMQESIVYLHGVLFMIGAGYTLMVGGHVRVDIFYRDARPTRKAIVDLAGVCLLLLPFCVIVIIVSWGPVLQSWETMEGSRETSGIQAVYLLRTVIPIFALLVGLQGISVAVRAILTLLGHEPRPIASDAAREGA